MYYERHWCKMIKFISNKNKYKKVGATWALLNDNNILYIFGWSIPRLWITFLRFPVQSEYALEQKHVCPCNMSPKSHQTKVCTKRVLAYIEHCFTVCLLSRAIYSPRWGPVPDSACCTPYALRGINTVFKETFRLSRDDGWLFCCHLGFCVLWEPP